MKNASETPKEIRDRWRTPRQHVDYYDRRFKFVMDVAADDDNHMFDMYYTERTNGLVQPWPPGAVWCNPPYSRITPWVGKAEREALTGTTTVFLVNADNSVGWFAHMWRVSAEIDFISGRVAFIRHDTGKPTGSNMRPQMVAIVTPESVRAQANDPLTRLIHRDQLK